MSSAQARGPLASRLLPAGPLSLRARLLAVLLVLVLCGLAIADVATYSRLRSFLLGRVDQQLDTAHRGVEMALLGAGGFGNPRCRGSQNAVQCALDDASRRYQGLFLQVRDSANSVQGNVNCYGRDGSETSPQLPARLPTPQASGQSAPSGYPGAGGEPPGGPEPAAYLDAPAAQRGASAFRVRVSPLLDSGWTLIVAQPLGEVAQTLRSLLAIELLVSIGVLAGAVAAGLWLVRVGLRPLDDIAATAATIAGGDLTQRVQRADGGTEIGRLGQSLNRMLGQIEAAFRERSLSEGRARQSEARMRRFVADASHELRTPLAAIRAYAELFRRGADQHPEDLPRLLRRIESEAARMGVLVEDLLLLTRLDQGRPLARRPVDLGALAAEAVEAARVVEPDRPLTLEVGESADAPNGNGNVSALQRTANGSVEVLGDADRLRQVVDNLLANVRAHTPPGAPAQVRVWADAARGSAFLEVADSGPGLTREQAERVFERFYRADSSRARARTPAGDAGAGGAGLGLSIVAAIAAAHGGSAAVRSTPGRGAAFRVELPLRHGNADRRAQPEEANGERRRGAGEQGLPSAPPA
jgi:two-component system OmpR family sensor kinase